MFKQAVAVAVPAIALAYMLSQGDPARRAAIVSTLQSQFGLPVAASVPVPVPVRQSTPAFMPSSLGPDSFAIDADRGGQFQTTMLIGGREFPCMVDTGATFVALSYDTAASIGIHPTTAEFRYSVQTANGIARAAAAMLRTVRVGNVEAHDVQALISAPGALTTRNLLGMSFLRRLSSFEIQSDRLVLKQ